MAILKRKPKLPHVKVGWSDRARGAVSRYPKITWGTVAAVVGILGVIVPWGISLEARYQRVEAAAAAEAKIREDMKAHAQADTRSQAWAQYGQQDMRQLVIGKWLVDCAVKIEQSKTPSAIERAACKEFESQWQVARERAEQARREAQLLVRAAP